MRRRKPRPTRRRRWPRRRKRRPRQWPRRKKPRRKPRPTRRRRWPRRRKIRLRQRPRRKKPRRKPRLRKKRKKSDADRADVLYQATKIKLHGGAEREPARNVISAQRRNPSLNVLRASVSLGVSPTPSVVYRCQGS